MIKVSRVTPYIPINILQIKFIELTVYILPLLYLFSFFTLLPISINFSCELAIALNCRPAQIAYARFEEEIRKETQKISTVFLFVDFFSFFFTRKAEKTGGNFNSFGFSQRSKYHWAFLLHLSFCCLRATLQRLINSCSWFHQFVEKEYEFLAHPSCTHTHTHTHSTYTQARIMFHIQIH